MAAIERLQLIRQIFPTFEKYGSQGYGHRLGNFFKLRLDSTEKTGVEKRYLVPHFVVRPNGIATGIARIWYRPETWAEYAEHLVAIRRLVINCLERLKIGLGDALQNKKPVYIFQHHINPKMWDECIALLSGIPELPRTAVDQWGFASESTDRNAPKLEQTELEQQKYVPKAIALRRYQPLLDAQRNFTSSIRNFLQQAIHVGVTSFRLSRLSPSEKREAIMTSLQSKGIQSDLQHLSTFNLWDAKRSITSYQEEFEHIFGHLINTKKLVRQEQDLLTEVWPLWYFYAHEPEFRKPGAFRKVQANVRHAKNRFLYRVGNVLEYVSQNEGITARLFTEHPDWNGASALWINLDVDNPVDLDAENPLRLNKAFEGILLPALRNEFGIINYQELSSYVIQEYFDYSVFVLTVRGRLPYEIVFPLNTLSTVLSNKEISRDNWISFKEESLPYDLKERLRLKSWESPVLSVANQFVDSITALMFVLSQIAEFADLPKTSESGGAVLQTHLNKRVKPLNEFCNQAVDSAQALLDIYDGLPKEEKEHVYLVRVYEYLTEFMELMESLFGGGNGRRTLELDDVVKYAQVLTEIFLVGEVVRQHWVAYLVTESE